MDNSNENDRIINLV